MSESLRTGSLYSAISQLVQSQVTQNIHTCIPGRIEKWDGKKANVLPLVPALMANGQSLSYPVINDVPVVFPGSSETTMSFPLKKGDGVLLLFCERNIDNFLQNGGEQTADTNRRFSITDCIAIPGLFSFVEIPNGEYDNTNMIIKHKNAEIKIDPISNVGITGTTIGINNADQAFIKGNDFVNAFTSFTSTVSAITPGSTAQNAAALTSIATAAGILNGLLQSLLSQTIKGE